MTNHQLDTLEERHFSPTQAARLIGCSRAIMYRWIQHGEIETTTDERGRLTIAGAELLRWHHDRHPDRPLNPLQSEATLLQRQALQREWGRVGGLMRSALHSREEIAEWFANGRRERMIERIDPEHKMPPAELERRLELAARAQLSRARAAKTERAILRERHGKKPR